MRKSLFVLIFIISATLLFLQVGCRFFGLGTVDQEIALSPESLAREDGHARVSFKIVLPGAPKNSPSPAVRASAGTASITFRLTLLDAGNPLASPTTLVKWALVDSSGTASIVFSDLPIRTVVGEMIVFGGSIGGRTNFHGGADLIDGDNEIELSPQGSGHRSDVLAQVILQIAAIPEMLIRLPHNLAASVMNAGAGYLDPGTNMLTASPTAGLFTEIVDRVLTAGVSAPTYTRIAMSDGGMSIQGSGPATWTRATSQIWGGTPHAVEFFRATRILRHGFGGFGYVLWESGAGNRFGLTRIDSSTGDLLNYLVLDGSPGPCAPMPDDGLLIGGSMDSLPLLVRWTGRENAFLTPSSLSSFSKAWAHSFSEVKPDVKIPEPGVDFLLFQPGSERIYCGVCDPRTGQTRHFAVDPSNGKPDPEESHGIPIWATPSDREVIVFWETGAGVVSSNLYWATQPFDLPSPLATKVDGAVSPFHHQGLDNGRAYYYRVTTIDGGGLESAPSSTVTSVPGDNTPPIVTEVFPAENALEVPVETTIGVIFSESMDGATLVPGSITLCSGTACIPGNVTFGPGATNATFTPDAALAYNTTYTATIGLGVKDLAGNPPAAEKSWSFTTRNVPDTTPPIVVSMTPASGAGGISTGTSVTMGFSEPMDPSSLSTSTIFLASGTKVFQGLITVSPDLTVATLTLEFPLAYSAQYRMTVKGTVADIAGNQMGSDHSWIFSTVPAPDTVPPVITTIDPPENAIEVGIGKVITVGFSEPMDASTLVPGNLSLASGSTELDGTVSVSPDLSTATFTPAAPLETGTTYTFTVGSSARDLAGNGLSQPRKWNFTTSADPDTTPPTIVSVFPEENSIDFPATGVIAVRFNEPIEAPSLSSGTFIVSDGASPVPGAILLGPDRTMATFTPTSPLPSGRQLSVTVTTGVKDSSGNALSKEKTWTFTTIHASDTTPPTVVSVSPLENSTGIGTQSLLIISFSEALEPSSVSTISVILSSGATGIDGAVTLASGGTLVTFVPAAPLAYSVQYSARVKSGIRDLAGNHLEAEKTWDFTTIAVSDTTPPTVVEVFPSENAVLVSTGTVVSVTFNEPMDLSTLSTETVTLSSGSIPVAGTLSFSGDRMTATFTPSASLAAETNFTATVKTGVKDEAGNSIQAVKSWTFTTAPVPDTTAPTVLSVDPAENSTDQGIGRVITVCFSEPMDQTTISTSTFSLASGSVPVAGTITIGTDGACATFTPDLPLEYGSAYTASVTTGVRDLAGNPLQASKVWSFTTSTVTDTTPPVVVSVLPSESAEGCEIGTKLTITFSEGMDPTSISSASITLASGTTDIPGTLSISPDRTIATFSPDSPLDYVTTYTATVKTTARDVAGNPLAAEKAWNFTTRTPDLAPPTVVWVLPAENAVGVATQTALCISFSEAMDPTSLSTATISLSSGVQGIEGSVTVSPDGTMATFTLLAALDYSSTLSAAIGTGARDLAGNPLSAPKAWVFSTMPAPDTIPPSVTSVAPASGAMDVPLSSALFMEFSEPIASSSLASAVSLVRVSDGMPVPLDQPTFGSGYLLATITIGEELIRSKEYEIRVSGLRDLAGNSQTLDFVSRFDTVNDRFEDNGTASTAATLVGTLGDLSIKPAGEFDWFRLTLATHSGLVIETDGEGGGDSLLALYSDPYSSPVAYDDDGGPGNYSRISLSYLAKGTYFVKVWCYSSSAEIASYQVSLTTSVHLPTVDSTVPASGATGFPATSPVTITFVEPMDPSSIIPANITLSSGTADLPGTITLAPDNRTATFTPTSMLPSLSLITLKIGTGVKDEEGNALASDDIRTFTTAAPDSTGPAVVETTPGSGSTGIFLDSSLTIGFSESMDASTIAPGVTLVRVSDSSPVLLSDPVFNGSKTVATLTPATALAGSTEYEARISGCKDQSGLSLASDSVWRFTTMPQYDPLEPNDTWSRSASITGTIGSLSMQPAGDYDWFRFDVDSISHVVLETAGTPGGDTVLTLFSDPLGTSIFENDDNGANAYSRIDLAELEAGTFYARVRCFSSSAQISSYQLALSVASNPPRIVTAIPASGSTDVAATSAVTITFSEPMNPLTLTTTNIVLKQGGTDIPGAISVGNGNRTATFTPDSPLPHTATFTVTVKTGVEDAEGTAMASETTWDFSTPDQTPPSIVSVSPAENASGILAKTSVGVVFSEPMDASTLSTSNFALASGTTGISGTIAFGVDRTTATFTPASPLPYQAIITATVKTGVKDNSGNHLQAEKTWDFSTASADNEPPLLLFLNPASGSMNIASNVVIGIVFDEPVATSTLNGTNIIVSSGGTNIPGTITFTGNGMNATFTPAGPLPYATISVTIGTGVTDLNGNPMAEQQSCGLMVIPRFVAVDGGLNHAIFLMEDGTVWTVGDNNCGQLGMSGLTITRTQLVKAYIDDAIAVSAGEYASYAIKSDGTLWAWGDNQSGCIGTSPYEFVPTPLQVGLSNVRQVYSGGGKHVLAVLQDGTVWSWGENSYGQLGDGTLLPHGTPEQVINLTDVVAVSAAGDLFSAVSFALKSDGTVWSWGLGVATPTQNASLSGIVSIVASYKASGGVYALKSDGTVLDGSGASLGISPIRSISSDRTSFGDHVIALKPDGTLMGMGSNSWGQLADNPGASSFFPINSISDIGIIGCGDSRSYCIDKNGLGWGFGENGYGELGIGNKVDTGTPTMIVWPSYFYIHGN